LLKRWQAWVKMRGAFGGHFAEQAQYLVNERVERRVIFDFGHDDDSVWRVQHFGCLGLIFRGRRSTL